MYIIQLQLKYYFKINSKQVQYNSNFDQTFIALYLFGFLLHQVFIVLQHFSGLYFTHYRKVDLGLLLVNDWYMLVYLVSWNAVNLKVLHDIILYIGSCYFLYIVFIIADSKS